MRSTVSGIIAKGGRASAALLLSAAMAFGGVPAVALAEDLQAEVQNENNPDVVLNVDQTATIKVPYNSGASESYKNVKVDGSVKVETSGDTAAKGAEVTQGKLEVTENVAATGDMYAWAVNERAETDDAVVEVGGNVAASVKSDSGESCGAWIYASGGNSAALTVGGDLKSSGGGISTALYVAQANKSEVDVTIDGDLEASASERNRALLVYQSGEGKVTVTVGGTIRAINDANAADQTGMMFSATDSSKITLNVWEIDQAMRAVLTGSGFSTNEAAMSFINSFNYIIKANAAKQNDYSSLGISLLNPAGTATLNKEDVYSTVKGDGTLNFRVDAPAGKKVKAVYGYYDDEEGMVAEAESLLVKNDDGTYTLKVRPGGGIMLYVEYEDVEEEKKPEEKKEGQEEEKKEERKEEKKEEAAPEQTHLASTGAATTSSRGLPATGDVSSLAPAAMMAIAGAGAVIAGRKGRKE